MWAVRMSFDLSQSTSICIITNNYLATTKNATAKLLLPPPKSPNSNATKLIHLADEVVDELLAITQITTLDEVFELACAETAGGRREFEGPQEVGRLLKVGTNSEDLVDQVFNRNDTKLAEVLLNEGIVGLGR